MRPSSLLRSCAYIASFISSVSAFAVSFTTPTQCDDFTVSWTGGQAPFYVLLTPKYHPLYNDTVPSSAFTNGQGSYTISQLPLPSGQEFLLTMSDSTGFNTGGTTTLLTVGDPVAGNNCNLNATQDFTFQLPLALKQCALFEFSAYDLAVPPVTITGLIPGGTFVQFRTNESSYNWTANVQAGTSLLFSITDSQGREGGVSDLVSVGDSTDDSCLVVGSPSSTASVASQPTSSQSTSGGSTANAGVIAGATVGSVVFLALLIILGICCRRKFRSSDVDSSTKESQYQVDGYGVQQDQEQQNLPSKHQRVHQPDSPTQLANVSPSDSTSPHARQMSLNSVTGNSSITSATRLMGSQTSPNAFPYPTPPIHPGMQLYPANGNVAVSDPYAPFNQIQPSRQASNLDAFAAPNYPYPYQAPASQYAPPATQPQHTSACGSSASDPPSPLSQTHPLNLNSNMDRFARPGDAGYVSPGARIVAPNEEVGTNQTTEFIMHTDVEDVPAVPAVKRVVELPPQYADRQLGASQNEPGPSS